MHVLGPAQVHEFQMSLHLEVVTLILHACLALLEVVCDVEVVIKESCTREDLQHIAISALDSDINIAVQYIPHCRLLQFVRYGVVLRDNR